jgi:hypothetical protein
VSRSGCDEVARWLDTGDPGTPPPAITAHARDCVSCGAALARARALDAWLGETLPTRAPAGFDTAVMVRLDAPVRRPMRAPLGVWPDPMPAWVRAVMDPAIMLALVLAALCLWQGERIGLMAMTATRIVGGALVGTSLPVPGWALALALFPVIAVASVALYQWSGRLVVRSARLHRGHP